jgi:hypothetical protein
LCISNQHGKEKNRLEKKLIALQKQRQETPNK